MHDRMLAGELYPADDPVLVEQNLQAMDLMEAFNATPMREVVRRRELLVELLGAVGERTEIAAAAGGLRQPDQHRVGQFCQLRAYCARRRHHYWR
ncbi:maltose acetyltransferase domain-containing protein [Nocardia sp. 2YAB30]|uniref:maltose acetyltransferase domain-containing protein n=1 Tax=unclassified Nocardia TaxID=2637762 RepID=UPI003F9AD957